ncbi:hypothetical protein [Lentibacter sp. XHP0401]|uniref:hypothetical protein n=1 Tax=Lentibacter sp. XHP0401 TaxID=2984334 RepID=UPI0021E9A82B|nr:hypothetical protein [Lentibacter sp. XHP0401]MCV2892573.1 hypothetical protein [Lentibacter sp. XHP0401]
MFESFKLTPKGKAWHVRGRKGAGAATEAAWVSLGGCRSQIVAVRVYLALVAKGGRNG